MFIMSLAAVIENVHVRTCPIVFGSGIRYWVMIKCLNTSSFYTAKLHFYSTMS